VYEIRAQDYLVETHKIRTPSKRFQERLDCFHEGNGTTATGISSLESSMVVLLPLATRRIAT
jgi:hypothetical protein